ncbi:zinc dependent phospholipase C family protein [Vibrio diabolicus]|uniref:zinc dependent phospholipase C family protein n=1 Tax=Vibrio diabolicus TaxID=50719 RepID=UPI00215FA7B8|nr:hypothetical protein [Vibrio diabolicus]MCS0437188.1 hypothetical protein [Vibrio diabolicus]
MKHKLLTALFTATTAVLMFFIGNASAFKVETHVWIAQNVINDLKDDGALNFKIDNQSIDIKVPTKVKESILNHQIQYRLGNIGPDSFPGIFEGQMVIHPGSEDGGWGTGDWLEHVLKSANTQKETAFAYGFIGHAASDIFAHTYVNHYSGDSYQLTDQEVEVEKRHFLLEGHIAKHMPPLISEDGRSLGTPSELILGESNEIPVPVDFLHRVFIDDNLAAEEFSKNSANHISLVHNLNQSITEMANSSMLANFDRDLKNIYWR